MKVRSRLCRAGRHSPGSCGGERTVSMTGEQCQTENQNEWGETRHAGKRRACRRTHRCSDTGVLAYIGAFHGVFAVFLENKARRFARRSSARDGRRKFVRPASRTWGAGSQVNLSIDSAKATLRTGGIAAMLRKDEKRAGGRTVFRLGNRRREWSSREG